MCFIGTAHALYSGDVGGWDSAMRISAKCSARRCALGSLKSRPPYLCRGRCASSMNADSVCGRWMSNEFRIPLAAVCRA